MGDELKKMLDEIYLDRKSKKCGLTTSDTLVNMDFASLYPNQMKWWNITPVPEKVILRKNKIKKIFQ